jgi:hypothetical protein
VRSWRPRPRPAAALHRLIRPCDIGMEPAVKPVAQHLTDVSRTPRRPFRKALPTRGRPLARGPACCIRPEWVELQKALISGPRRRGW